MSFKDVLDLFPAPSFRHEYQKQALLQVAEAFFENDYKTVLLQSPTGSGKCVKAGTLISTTKGLIPIEDVELNQEVYTFRDGKIETGKVTGKYQFKNQKTIKVVTRCGYEIEGTTDHRIVVYNDGLKWKHLKDISKEDYVLIVAQPVEGSEAPLRFIPKKRVKRSRKDGKRHYFVPKHIDEELAWFIGLYLAEGCIVEYNGSKRVSITTSEELLQRIEEFLKRWNQQYSARYKKGADCITVDVYSPNMVDFLKYLGCGGNSHNKRIPNIFFQLPISHRASLIRGIFDGDGYLSAGGVGIVLVSQQLIKDIQKLLLSMGILSVVNQKKMVYKGETKVVFRLTIIRESIERFYELVGEFYTSSKTTFDELLSKKRNTNIVTIPMRKEIWSLWEFYKRFQKRNMKNGKKKLHSPKFEVVRRGGHLSYPSLKTALDAISGAIKTIKVNHPVKKTLEFFENLIEMWEGGTTIFFDKVEEIKESVADVYDLTVEPDHNYISNGFISHNSLIVTAIARAFDSAYITTPQIPLIDQLMNDPYIKKHVAFVKGRENYPCILQSSLSGEVVTAAHGDCRKFRDFHCPKSDLCPYMRAKRAALASKIAGMTFAYFLYEKGRQFKERDLLVVDECHTAENWAFIHTDIEIDTSSFPISIKIPEIKDNQQLLSFVEETSQIIHKVIKKYIRKSEESGLTDKELRYFDWLNSVYTTLDIFLSDSPEDWIFEIERGAGRKGGDILRLKPLYGRMTLKRYVWSRAKKYLLSSATILDPEQFLNDIGLKTEDYKVIDIPSYFPKANRATYCIPLGKMTRKNEELSFPRIAAVIESILKKHEGEKGFIHCHSYRLQRALADYLRSTDHALRIVTHNSHDRNEAYRNWLVRLDDSVFLSVNMTEGIDLKYDLARFQILVKCPFASLEDKRVKARLDRKEWHWYNLQALRTVIQACGRVVRSADDYGVTYILDTSIIDLIKKYRKYCPKWFLEQLVFVKVVG